MDNDNKVNKRHDEVLLFLNEELNNLQLNSENDTYNLEEEYAKTKKNKSFFSVLIIVACIIVIGAVAWGVNSYISHQNEEIKVSLQEFDSLNLKSLLDSVSKVQGKYDAAIKNKAQYTEDYNRALSEAENKLERDYFLIDSLALDDEAEIARRKEAAKAQYDELVEQHNILYENYISEIDAQINEYSQQLGNYDSDKVQSAKEQDSQINSERQVQELEKQQLTKRYEQRISQLEERLRMERKDSAEELRKAVSEVRDKYQAEIALLDPVIKDVASEKLMAEMKEKAPDDFNAYSVILGNNIEDETISSGLQKYQKQYNDYHYIRTPIVAIPHKNSAPDYIKTSSELVADMGQTFSDTVVALNSEKLELKSEIEDLNSQIDGLNVQIETMTIEHQQELERLEQQKQADLQKQRENLEKCIEASLAIAKSNAAVISADSTESVRVYVTPKARYLVGEEGLPVEIKGEKTVKGMIIADEQTAIDSYYGFVPAAEFDLKLVAPGHMVKLISK
ncbi:MAG: hypothetical protein MJ162_00895 [Treponema sp.]|nr:hypothetical protein [Treponema sp.]